MSYCYKSTIAMKRNIVLIVHIAHRWRKRGYATRDDYSLIVWFHFPPRAPRCSRGSPPQQPPVAQELSWCRPPSLLKHLLSKLPNSSERMSRIVPSSHIQSAGGSLVCSEEGSGAWLHKGKLSVWESRGGAQCARVDNNVEKETVERKVKVDWAGY